MPTSEVTSEVNGTTLHYERSGQGPAMLFVHGMCGDADVWADQARRFSGRGATATTQTSASPTCSHHLSMSAPQT
jgi:hypothetical protein